MNPKRISLVIQTVQQGVRWLKGNADNLKGARDIAITVSALVAAERNPHSHLVEKLVLELVKQQNPQGSWADELWDTVWAAKALHDAGYSIESDPLQKAFQFLQTTRDALTGNWYEEPFETMLVLDLIIRTAPQKIDAFCKRALEWVESLQDPHGCIVGIRYTGMAASLFYLAQKIGLVQSNKVSDAAIKHIREVLQDKPIWTGASWSNYYPLKGLLDCGATFTDVQVRKVVDWFVKSQDIDGKWMQVSRVHDTAMAILGLSGLLTTPLVDISDPSTGIINAFKENGTIRVTFQEPTGGAITAAERMKISDQVRADLSHNQQLIVSTMRRVRGTLPSTTVGNRHTSSVISELEKAGRYAYGHLIPARIQTLLAKSPADHLRLDIDERLIDLPWELVHDGEQFLCLRYALGRRLVSDQDFTPPRRHPRTMQDIRVLIVANPTGDLPAAGREGHKLTKLLHDKCRMRVDEFTAAKMTKKDFLLSFQNYDIVHFAGHASHDPKNPDESSLVFSDGEIQAFEIARFITSRSPAVVFLNACWSAEELRDPDSYSPMMRGLGRTFLYAGVAAFLGYLVPVPDQSATRFALSFYEALIQGRSVGESLRRARINCWNSKQTHDLTWSSAILYGDPAARVIEIEA